jgi:FtsP/CotA-like multicopper oxidase with cupredoxin domain
MAANVDAAACIPRGANPGVLPKLPVIDANEEKSFDLYVKQGAPTAFGTPYCYVRTPDGDVSYEEAPTIHIRQNGTFTLRLHDMIPGQPSPWPTPPTPIIRTTDDCAWLPFDSATFPPADPAATPPGYFGHVRATIAPDPAWMLQNDTNLHTHGWHVDPYVDNVFKSLVFAPSRNVCSYTFYIPPSQPPGTYWYHAHLHGLSDSQVGGGLAGVLIVDPTAAPRVDETILLVKSSTYKNQAGSVTTPGPHPMLGAMAGMQGPVEGRPAPAAHYAQLAARRGTEPSPCAISSARPYPAFSPPPWCSGIAWPTAPATPPGYCHALPAKTSDVADPLTVNGAIIPAVINGTLVAAAVPSTMQTVNTTHRYSIVNAASDSFIDVVTLTEAHPGAPARQLPLRVVARDGVPVNWNFETNRVDPSKPGTVVVNNVFVPPSSRVDILITMPTQPLIIASAAGTPASQSAQGYPYCIGYFGFGTQPQRDIVRLTPFYGPGAHRTLSLATAVQQRANISAAATLVQHDLPRVTRSRAITFTMYPGEWNVTMTGDYAGANPPSSVQALPYTERPFWLVPGSNPVDPKYPYVPWVRVHQNDVEEWYLYNATGEVHAFHIHQLTFVALESPFEATNPYQQVFLDSIGLPAGKLAQAPVPGQYPLLTPSLTKILIDFRNVHPGVFVFHCHMLFHEDHGMMGVVEVLPAVRPAPTSG